MQKSTLKTRGEAIQDYKKAFENGTEGAMLLETMNALSVLNCSSYEKSLCLRQEIDHLICGYMESR